MVMVLETTSEIETARAPHYKNMQAGQLTKREKFIISTQSILNMCIKRFQAMKASLFIAFEYTPYMSARIRKLLKQVLLLFCSIF